MKPFVVNDLPKTNEFVILFIQKQGESSITKKIGYWGGSYWVYITKPPNITSFEQHHVIGWENMLTNQ